MVDGVPRDSDVDHPHDQGVITGVGAVRRVSAMRWNVAQGIVAARVVRMPAAGLGAAALYEASWLVAG